VESDSLIPFNLAETLLFNLNLIKFLDCVDAGYERRHPPTTQVVDSFFEAQYGAKTEEVAAFLPFLRDCTSLVILTPAFAFGATLDNNYWHQIGFTIEERFQIEYLDLDIPGLEPTPQHVLQVLSDACQNLVSSLCDQRFGASIFHAGESVVFKSPGFSLTFGSASGLGAFIQRYVQVLSRAIRENLLGKPSD
jgi:hypothetical protein